MQQLRQVWDDFIGEINRQDLNVHAIALGRGEEAFFKAHARELDPSDLHRQFSVTKTYTAMALMCLVEDGKITLDDKIIDYYPDLADETDFFTSQLTIRDMLLMETSHRQTTYKINDQDPWVDSFFKIKGDHMPGSHFCYDTSSSHTLCNLVEKMTGQKLLDFLRSRGLKEVGFSDEAYIIEDPEGHSMGGSGLMATLEDMYLFNAILAQDGIYKGRTILSPNLVKEAVKKHVDTQMHLGFPAESHGYGYQLWRHARGWWTNGMGGQFGIYVEDLDLLLVLNANFQKYKGQGQLIFDTFQSCILDKIETEDLRAYLDSGLASDIHDLAWEDSLQLMKAQGDTEWSKTIERQGSYKTDLGNEKGLLDIAVKGETLSLAYHGKDDLSYVLKRGIQNEVRLAGKDHRAFVSWEQTGPDRIYILVQVLDEELGFLHAEVRFLDDAVSCHLENQVERYYDVFKGYYYWPLES